MSLKSKKIVAGLTLFLALGSFSARAQMADRILENPSFNSSAHVNVVAVTREMANRLHLNEGQYLKLLPLNRTKYAGMISIDRQFKNDEGIRTQKKVELEAQFEQECSRILSPSQLSQLQQENGQPATAPANTGNGLG